MSYWKVIAWTLITFFTFVGPLSADPCNDLANALGVPKDQLGDGITYVRVGSKWRALTDLTDMDLSRPVTLQGIHVIKTFGQERNGVVIVKTGRVAPVTSRSARNVALVRRVYNQCNPSVSVSSVSGDAYDAYHDFSRTNFATSELRKLDQFHTKFGSNCSQSTNSDPGGPGRHYSNRAQFSFSEDIVDNGQYTGVIATVGRFGFGPASAGPKPIDKIERQAEIISYDTEVGFACLRVAVPYSDQGSFFRTNDLGWSYQNGTREKRYWKRDNQ